MTDPRGWGAAFDADIVTGDDSQRAAVDDAAVAADTVARLTTKRDKIAAQLADAKRALAEAKAVLKGEG